MKFLLTIFFLIIANQAYASQTLGVDVPCPTQSEVGYIRFVFSTSVAPGNGVIATGMTNMETRQGVLWNHEHEMLFKAKCDNPLEPMTSHVSFYSDYNGVIIYSSEWVADEVVGWLYPGIFAFGCALAFAFIGGIKSGEKL